MKLYAAIYQLAIYIYFTAIRIVSFFNDKAKLFVKGREGLFPKIEAAMAADNRPSVWMHCASLGEFEQGRPVLEALRAQYPQYAIVLTFFSPSGYEVRKNYEGADHVFYLPMDSNRNARKLLNLLRPALCVFVKYEFWYFYLSDIARRKIPVILVSAVFNSKQGFFKWYGGLQRDMLQCFSQIFVQDYQSAVLLNKINITNVTVSGDTRFDRVIKAAAQAEHLGIADSFTQNHKVLVAGSTWKEDELFIHKLLKIIPKSWKIILVPHEVNKEHIAEIEKLFAGNTVLWSAISDHSKYIDNQVLIVDRVGLLLQLYRYGTAAWIGGGFGKDGVHNILEAAVYGVPCFYGPIFHQFIEAQELIERVGAYTVTEADDLAALLKGLDDPARYAQQSTAAKKYVFSKGGATEKVMGYVNGGLLS